MDTLDSITLSRLAPDSLTADGTSLACMEAIDPELRACAALLGVPYFWDRIGTADSGLCDHLARWLDTEGWNDDWSAQIKRAAVASTIARKREVGTLAAVKDALSLIGARADVTEWWQTSPKGTPHTFTVTVTLSGGDEVTDEVQTRVQRLIDAAKPVRSHYTFIITTSVAGGQGGGAAARPMAGVRVATY